MIEYINANVPQLIVLPQSNYHSVSKKHRDILDQTFLWSYLSQKFAEYSIKHHAMNEQLRIIYLIHTDLAASRANEDMYSMDDKHYRQLFFTNQVCQGISLIVSELLYCIYFMKQLKTHSQMPCRIEIPLAIDFIMDNIELKDQLSSFSTFTSQTEEIRHSYHLNTIRPGHDYFMTKTEPVYFVTSKNGTLSTYLLRKYIEEYNSFFHTCRIILRHHSPEAISIGLEKWAE